MTCKCNIFIRTLKKWKGVIMRTLEALAMFCPYLTYWLWVWSEDKTLIHLYTSVHFLVCILIKCFRNPRLLTLFQLCTRGQFWAGAEARSAPRSVSCVPTVCAQSHPLRKSRGTFRCRVVMRFDWISSQLWARGTDSARGDNTSFFAGGAPQRES